MTTRSGAFPFRSRRRLPVIRQCEAAECGLACLAMIASYHGRRTNLAALRLQHAVTARGATLNQLMTTAERLDLGTRALRLEMDSLDRLALPCILHWEMNHFVVLARIVRGRFTVHDPAAGVRSLTRSEMSAGFTGIALELRPTVSFAPRDERRRLRLRDIWSRATGLRGALLQTLLLSVVIQCLLLAAPFYLQLVVDEALARFDSELLVVLAVAFGLLVLLRELATALRAWQILYVGSSLDYGLAINLASRIFHLPMAWFERRHVGDVISRLSSTRAVRNLFAEGLVASVIDGIMALGTLVIMLFYSAALTAVVVSALALSLTVRLLLYRPLRQCTEEGIVAKAAEQSTLIESIRAMQSIKVFGREPQRLSYWQNRLAEAINASVRLGRLGIGIGFANGLLFGIEHVIVVCFAALAVLDGSFTVGMLFAFMAYKQHLLDAAVALVERVMEIRLLGVHLDRMADIALASPEIDGAGSAPPRTATPRRRQPVLSLSKCRFSFCREDEPLFDELSLDVEEGEFLVIVGPSGSGKSTLLKMLLGLRRPDRGKVLYRGVPITRIANAEYRRRFGTVMQDDRLLSGTLAENIAFFDPEPQLERVFACARLAAIYDEIAAMPMGFNSLVGDMGSVLSAGQRQRVLLARALYAEPEVLILDEGTANLDPASERAVLDTLCGLDCTRICVAHGDAILRRADRAFVLWDRALRPLGGQPALRQTDATARAAGSPRTQRSN